MNDAVGATGGSRALLPISPELAMQLVAPVSDVVLVLDAGGVVRRASFAASERITSSCDGWVDRPWIDTVTRETRTKAGEILREAASQGTSRSRQVNHPSLSGPAVPVAYTGMAIGEAGQLLLAGRDLRAYSAMQQRLIETQQTMERDYSQMRQAEARYRMLFKLASDAILVVEPDTLRISDANLAAGRLHDVAPEALVGRSVESGVAEESRPGLVELLQSARTTGLPAEATLRFAGSEREVAVSATPFRAGEVTPLLLRVSAADLAEVGPAAGTRLAAIVERIPDAVVLTDADAHVVTCNPAFLELVQLVHRENARGRSLGDWIGRPGADLSMILAIVKSSGTLRVLPTRLRAEHGPPLEVEVSAALLPGTDGAFVGFVLRRIANRSLAVDASTDLSAAVARLTELVGRVSLPELVRETTELVERHAIRAALELTGGNRTTAAEVLGVSRQSLYVKLRRRGLLPEEIAQESLPQR